MARKRYNTAVVDRRRAAVAAYRLRSYSQREILGALPAGLARGRRLSASKRPSSTK